METVYSFEISGFFPTNISEDRTFHSHLCESPKSNLTYSFKKNYLSLLHGLGFIHRMIEQFKLHILMVYDFCASSNYSEYMHTSFEET
jgi:hypothetical protein